MTVGVVLTNGLEAVVIADSRVSGFGRQSDSVNKMGVFSSENYSGVIFGAGNANLIEEVIKYANQFSGENLKDFISAAQLQHKSSVDNNDMAYLRYLKGEIDKKADTMFADEAERNQFIQQQTAMAIQQYEQFKNIPEGQTSFILTAFDRSRKKMRNFRYVGRRCQGTARSAAGRCATPSRMDTERRRASDHPPPRSPERNRER